MSNFSVSAACVVTNNEGDILLIQRADNSQWQIPGGVVELGETPIEAAVRETQEESGITPSNLVLTGVYTNLKRGIFAHVFRGDAISGTPTLSDETTAVEFVPSHVALQRVPEIFTLRISDALEHHASVIFRAHDGERWVG